MKKLSLRDHDGCLKQNRHKITTNTTKEHSSWCSLSYTNCANITLQSAVPSCSQQFDRTKYPANTGNHWRHTQNTSHTTACTYGRTFFLAGCPLITLKSACLRTPDSAATAAAVLLVGTLEQSPRANTLLYRLCCKVSLLTSTHPAASEMGLPTITSRGPIGGVTCSMEY